MSDVVDFPRGSNSPFTFTFEDDEGQLLLDGSELRLTIKTDRGVTFTLSTDEDDNLIIDGTDLVWTPTLAESRLIPEGNRTKWEIERRILDTQEIWGVGRFNGVGGLNDD